jgi:putative transposase
VGGDHVDRVEVRMTAETLRKWVGQAEVDGGRRQGLTTEQRKRVRELEREVKELRRANEILKSAGAVTSVGSRGDSYDNALAESMIGLYKAELVRNSGPWCGLDDLELATLEWVGWWNHRRLLEPIGNVPPAEKEADYYRQNNPAQKPGLKPTSL